MDVFAGLDGLDSRKTQKLSLAEQQKIIDGKQKSIVNAFDTLASSNKTFASTMIGQTPVTVSNTSNQQDDDIFGLFSTPTQPPSQQPLQPQKPVQQPRKPSHLLDDNADSAFADQSILTSASSSSTASILESDNLGSQYSKSSYSNQNTFDSTPSFSGSNYSTSTTYGAGSSRAGPSNTPSEFKDSKFSSKFDTEFDNEFDEFKQTSSNRQAGTQRSATTKPATNQPGYVTDRNLNAMVEMGFEPKDATRALNAMHGSVHGAVNWLMAEAQGLPLPAPKDSVSIASLSDFQQSASQIGASMFSKASKLFSKGKKEIEKIYTDYSNAANADSAHPAWMNDKPKQDMKREFKKDFSQPLPRRPQPRSRTPLNTAREQDSAPPAVPDRAQTDTPDLQARKNRAELFRRKQMERQASKSGSNTPPASTTPAPTATRASTRAPGSAATNLVPDLVSDLVPDLASSNAEETITEQVDLLNLDSTTVVTHTTELSSAQSDMFAVAREAATTSFKNGDYDNAVVHYSAALDVLPPTHTLRTVMLSNRSAAHLKNGNAQAAFVDSSLGIKHMPNRGKDHEIEGKKASDIWMKLVTRNAQAAEHMEKFEDAIKSWQLLLDNGYASSSVLDAKRRCLRALDIHRNGVAEPAKPVKTSKRRGWGTMGAQPTSAEGIAAVAKVKNLHEQQKKDENERELYREKVTAKVDAWMKGNETNLCVLLSTLQNVLWPECQWQPVPLSDLVVPKKVRVVYMKAVARTHPDKISSNSSTEIKMTAQAVFMAVQAAWEVYRQENNL